MAAMLSRPQCVKQREQPEQEGMLSTNTRESAPLAPSYFENFYIDKMLKMLSLE